MVHKDTLVKRPEVTNIFLTYTPFHAEYARAISKQHFSRQENIVLNHFSKKDVVAEPGDKFSRVLNTGKKLSGAVAALFQFKREMLAASKSGKEVNILIPHSLGILSNYAYHRVCRKYPNVRIHIFYEGIIVFYSYAHGYRDNLKYYASRWLVSLMLGILYVPDKQILSLYDSRIASIYSPFLNIAAPREKIVLTPLSAVSFVPENNCVILGIGLPADQQEELKKIVIAIYHEVKRLGIEKVYYKEHPLDKSDVFGQVAAGAGVELIPITDTSPVEKIIHLYRPSFVFSSWSSGLINLKGLVPGSTHICCFVTPAIVNTRETKKLVDVFRQEKIEVIYV
jgi:hypothetical protein